MTEKIVCSNTVDYSDTPGDRILPFVFTLNTEDSILNPEEGQFQTFCYDVDGVGEDTSEFADLSHFVLGICPELTQEDFVSVTVVIDGVEQEVVWGENVEIKTAENPDPPTGCVGLKIDFPLDKVDGMMQVCFALAEERAIGPVNVCVFGGNVTVTGQSICGPVCEAPDEGCTSTFYQEATVCVPVRVRPFATAGDATATCCGTPVVSSDGSCSGSRNGCGFTVTQRLCIEIPITFGADVETGAALTQCGGVTTTGCSCSVDSGVATTIETSSPAGSTSVNDRKQAVISNMGCGCRR